MQSLDSPFLTDPYVHLLPYKSMADKTNQQKKCNTVKTNVTLWSKLINTKISPCALTEHHAMKAYRGNGGIAPLIIWPGL